MFVDSESQARSSGAELMQVTYALAEVNILVIERGKYDTTPNR